MTKVLIFVVTLNDMWYFVEKNGRCISKHKVLVSAKLRKMQEVKAGINPDSLKITDLKGKSY